MQIDGLTQAGRINIENLPSVSLKDLKSLPEDRGIYFAIGQAGDLLYVGASKNIRKRWVSHNRLKDLKAFDDVRIAYLLVCDGSDIFEIEDLFIARLAPSLNSTSKSLFTTPAGISKGLKEAQENLGSPLQISKILEAFQNPYGGIGITAYQAARQISEVTGKDRVAVENVLSRWKNGKPPNLAIAELYLGALGVRLDFQVIETPDDGVRAVKEV
jgi:hypothetical protein